MSTMKPFATLPDAALRRVRGILTDIDGTLTTDGRLPASTYLALDQLARAGLHVVPVTGRCIAWAEILVRLWPVDAIIGENGAFFSHLRNNKLITRFLDNAPTRAGNLEKIHALGERIVREVPGCALASDRGLACGGPRHRPRRGRGAPAPTRGGPDCRTDARGRHDGDGQL